MTVTTAADHAILGLLAAGRLCLHHDLAEAARWAPSATEAMVLVAACGPVAEQAAGLLEVVSRAEAHLEPVRGAVRSFTRHTQPQDWGRALLKLWLEVRAGAALVDISGQHWPLASAQRQTDLSGEVLAEVVHQRLVVLLEDEQARQTQGLYGRRVIGEGTAQAQRIASRDSELMSALTGATPGSPEELAESTQLIAQLVEASAQALLDLGLQA